MGKRSIQARSAGLLLNLMDPSSASSVSKECHDALIAHLETLTPVQMTIIDMRYGLGCPQHSYREIAEHLKIPVYDVRQIEIKIVSRMHTVLFRHCSGRSHYRRPISREQLREIQEAIENHRWGLKADS